MGLAQQSSGQTLPPAEAATPVETPPPTEEPLVLGPNERVVLVADKQEIDGIFQKLHGRVRILTDTGIYIIADEAEHNTETQFLKLWGKVRFESRTDGYKMSCSLAEYDVQAESGQFFNVTGSVPSSIETKPGVLTTMNPFYFSGPRAEKLKDRYVLHDGFLTDCKPDDVWWRLKAKKMEIIPRDRAETRWARLYVKNVQVFPPLIGAIPVFRKSLETQPRRSGFLTPNIGNSSQRGQTVGLGYFWAINRSYDVTYRTHIKPTSMAGSTPALHSVPPSLACAEANQPQTLRRPLPPVEATCFPPKADPSSAEAGKAGANCANSPP